MNPENETTIELPLYEIQEAFKRFPPGQTFGTNELRAAEPAKSEAE